MKVLFVCTGNTCRSPMAEALADGYIKEKKLQHQVSSAALLYVNDSKVSTSSVNAMKKYNIDISKHIPRPLTIEDIIEYDLILTMTNAQSDIIKMYFSDYKDKIYSLGEYTNSDDITDPYGQPLEVYEKSADDIYKAVLLLFSKLENDK